MKRLILLLLGVGLGALIGMVGWNSWQCARFFHDQGREATVVIGKRYNAERWTTPPIKQIRSYTAKLEPQYEVLLETDQELKDGETRQIRFLTRDLATDLVDYSMRPVANSLRLRAAEDGSPVKIEDTRLFDEMVDKWMGPPGPGVQIRPRAQAEAAPSHAKPTVPFVFAEKNDGPWDILWTNSRIQEWALLGLGLLGVQSLLLAAYDRQKDARLKSVRGKKFVHPSLRKIEADAPEAASKKIAYTRKPEVEIVLSEAEKRRRDTPAPKVPETPLAPEEPTPERPSLSLRSGARSTPPSPATPPPAVTPLQPADPTEPSRGPLAGSGGAPTTPTLKPADEPVSLTGRETAPPMPINSEDVVLKLRRKPDGGGGIEPPAANG